MRRSKQNDEVMRKNSTRYAVLAILQEHPDGLAAPRLAVLLKARRAICDHYEAVVLSKELKKGNVKIVGKAPCCECGRANSLYSITRKGIMEMAEAE